MVGSTFVASKAKAEASHQQELMVLDAYLNGGIALQFLDLEFEALNVQFLEGLRSLEPQVQKRKRDGENVPMADAVVGDGPRQIKRLRSTDTYSK